VAGGNTEVAHALMYWKAGTRTTIRQWAGNSAAPSGRELSWFKVNAHTGAIVLVEYEKLERNVTTREDNGWCARQDDGSGLQVWACIRYHVSVAASPTGSFNPVYTRAATPGYLPNTPTAFHVGAQPTAAGAIKLSIALSATRNGQVEPAGSSYRELVSMRSDGATVQSPWVLPGDLPSIYEQTLLFDSPPKTGWASTATAPYDLYGYSPGGVAWFDSQTHIQWRNVNLDTVLAQHTYANPVGTVMLVGSTFVSNRLGGMVANSTSGQWYIVTLRGQPLP
jgi:hypothetical protein